MVATSTETPSALLNLSNHLANAVERSAASIVAVNARRHSPSTGIHWQQNVIVTADHTLERDDHVTVSLPSGQEVGVTVAGRDAGTDLAVLKAEGLDLTLAESSTDALQVGHIVLAVARPGNAGPAASLGTVSAVGGPWRTWAGGDIDQLVRPDLTLYPGFSGGPLVDAAGRVAGINTSGLSRAMPLTIPVQTVNRVVEQLLSKGRIARGYLGLGMQPVRLPDSLKSTLQLTANEGLIVVSVEEAGPADRAGAFVGDIVVALDGKPVSGADQVQSLLGPERVGNEITLGLVRGGARADVRLTVGERPNRGG